MQVSKMRMFWYSLFASCSLLSCFTKAVRKLRMLSPSILVVMLSCGLDGSWFAQTPTSIR